MRVKREACDNYSSIIGANGNCPKQPPSLCNAVEVLAGGPLILPETHSKGQKDNTVMNSQVFVTKQIKMLTSWFSQNMYEPATTQTSAVGTPEQGE